MKTRILLADDHKVLREGLVSLLEKEPQLEVVGEAEEGRTAVELACTLRPDVVVMDVGMPDLNGIEATRRIKREAPEVKVLALSIHADRRFVAGMLEAGASGYLLKTCAFEELVEAIRTVASDRFYTSPEVTDIVVADYVRRLSQREPVAGSLSSLTGREREVLQLLAEGKSSKDIALRLHVGVNTVDTHRHHIMKKLKVHSLAELTKYAIREGLTSLEP